MQRFIAILSAPLLCVMLLGCGALGGLPGGSAPPQPSRETAESSSQAAEAPAQAEAAPAEDQGEAAEVEDEAPARPTPVMDLPTVEAPPLADDPADEAPAEAPAGAESNQANLRLTVNGVSELKSDEFIQPEQGMRFIAVDLTVENGGVDHYTVSAFLMMELEAADGAHYEVDLGATVLTDPVAEGDLAPGASLKGFVPFQVPLDEERYTLVYDDFMDTTLRLPLPGVSGVLEPPPVELPTFPDEPAMPEIPLLEEPAAPETAADPAELGVSEVHMFREGLGDPEEVEAFVSGDWTQSFVFMLDPFVSNVDVRAVAMVNPGTPREYAFAEDVMNTGDDLNVLSLQVSGTEDWPPGSYGIDLYVGDELLYSHRYEVLGG